MTLRCTTITRSGRKSVASAERLKADKNARFEELLDSSERGDIRAVEMLLSDDPSLVNWNDKKKQTALIFATAHGNLECVALLIERGADLSTRDFRYKGTPLHFALYNYESNYFTIGLLLAQNGADLTCKNKNGQTPLDVIGGSQNPPISAGKKKECVTMLQAAHAAFLLKKTREENWQRRKNFLQVLIGSGLRATLAKAAEQAAEQASLDPAAPLPDELMDHDYFLRFVFGNDGISRRVTSFL